MCGGDALSYHQAVLTPLSPFLAQMIKSLSCCPCSLQACPDRRDVIITLDNVDIETLKVVMNCVYTGRFVIIDIF